MSATLNRGLSAKGRANDSGRVRIDGRGHLHDFACRRDHQLPGLDHDELPIGVAEVPENPDGQLVVVQSGQLVISPTGEIIKVTPAVNPDNAAVICPALGGQPAT